MKEDKINKVADKLQRECHQFSDDQFKRNNCSLQTGNNVWTFKKLAKLQLRIEELESDQLDKTDTVLN